LGGGDFEIGKIKPYSWQLISVWDFGTKENMPEVLREYAGEPMVDSYGISLVLPTAKMRRTAYLQPLSSGTRENGSIGMQQNELFTGSCFHGEQKPFIFPGRWIITHTNNHNTIGLWKR
jgi:hypothetical protein